MRTVFKHIDRFVRLRRFEKFALKEATHGLKSRYFPPEAASETAEPNGRTGARKNKNKNKSQNKNENENKKKKMKRAREHPNRLRLRQRLLSDWVYWIFTQLVMPLIHTGFYATECEGFRNRVFFFRKPVWAVVRRTTLRKLNGEMFQPLSEAEAALVVSRYTIFH